jgi:hypothetical protein
MAELISGLLQADADENRSRQARKNQEKDNAQNYLMWQESRGSTGHSIMPEYTNMEPRLMAQLVRGFWNTGMGGPKRAVNNLRQQTQPYKAMLGESAEAVRGLFDGSAEQTMLSNQAPVSQARREYATQTAQAAQQDLADTLSAIEASQAQGGFTGAGEGLGSELLNLRARTAAGNTGTEAINAAELLNAQDIQGIQNYAGVQLPLSNLSLPYAMGQEAMALELLPENTYIDLTNRRLQPLSFMEMDATPFKFKPVNYQAPRSNMAGAMAGSAATVAKIWGGVQQANQARSDQWMDSFMSDWDRGSDVPTEGYYENAPGNSAYGYGQEYGYDVDYGSEMAQSGYQS